MGPTGLVGSNKADMQMINDGVQYLETAINPIRTRIRGDAADTFPAAGEPDLPDDDDNEPPSTASPTPVQRPMTNSLYRSLPARAHQRIAAFNADPSLRHQVRERARSSRLRVVPRGTNTGPTTLIMGAIDRIVAAHPSMVDHHDPTLHTTAAATAGPVASRTATLQLAAVAVDAVAARLAGDASAYGTASMAFTAGGAHTTARARGASPPRTPPAGARRHLAHMSPRSAAAHAGAAGPSLSPSPVGDTAAGAATGGVSDAAAPPVVTAARARAPSPSAPTAESNPASPRGGTASPRGHSSAPSTIVSPPHDPHTSGAAARARTARDSPQHGAHAAARALPPIGAMRHAGRPHTASAAALPGGARSSSDGGSVPDALRDPAVRALVLRRGVFSDLCAAPPASAVSADGRVAVSLANLIATFVPAVGAAAASVPHERVARWEARHRAAADARDAADAVAAARRATRRESLAAPAAVWAGVVHALALTRTFAAVLSVGRVGGKPPAAPDRAARATVGVAAGAPGGATGSRGGSKSKTREQGPKGGCGGAKANPAVPHPRAVAPLGGDDGVTRSHLVSFLSREAADPTLAMTASKACALVRRLLADYYHCTRVPTRVHRFVTAVRRIQSAWRAAAAMRRRRRTIAAIQFDLFISTQLAYIEPHVATVRRRLAAVRTEMMSAGQLPRRRTAPSPARSAAARDALDKPHGLSPFSVRHLARQTVVAPMWLPADEGSAQLQLLSQALQLRVGVLRRLSSDTPIVSEALDAQVLRLEAQRAEVTKGYMKRLSEWRKLMDSHRMLTSLRRAMTQPSQHTPRGTRPAVPQPLDESWRGPTSFHVHRRDGWDHADSMDSPMSSFAQGHGSNRHVARLPTLSFAATSAWSGPSLVVDGSVHAQSPMAGTATPTLASSGALGTTVAARAASFRTTSGPSAVRSPRGGPEVDPAMPADDGAKDHVTVVPPSPRTPGSPSRVPRALSRGRSPHRAPSRLRPQAEGGETPSAFLASVAKFQTYTTVAQIDESDAIALEQRVEAVGVPQAERPPRPRFRWLATPEELVAMTTELVKAISADDSEGMSLDAQLATALKPRMLRALNCALEYQLG